LPAAPSPRKLFLPGFGARASAYARGLPAGWGALQPPTLRRDAWRAHAAWLAAELSRAPGPVVLAGHSMGAALALAAAEAAPGRIARLVLIGPAGLPLDKPIRASAADFVAQLRDGRHRARDVVASALELAAAPVAAARLVRVLRALDLSPAMRRVRACGVAAVVIGCATDTLTTPRHARRIADLLGADYRELAVDGGHAWMFGDWGRLRSELARVA
jgi:pimeloyl-ACP methyl ester carboxylesterase